jgi:DNA processing protein
VGKADATMVGGLSEVEQRVLECFRGGSILNIDTLVGLTQMPAHELGATLMLLELKRLVVKRVDGAFEAR